MKKKSLGKQIIEGLEEAVRFENGKQTGATVKGVIPKDAKNRRNCPNCGKEIKRGEGHYVPPSLGEEGFFACISKNNPAQGAQSGN